MENHKIMSSPGCQPLCITLLTDVLCYELGWASRLLMHMSYLPGNLMVPYVQRRSVIECSYAFLDRCALSTDQATSSEASAGLHGAPEGNQNHRRQLILHI